MGPLPQFSIILPTFNRASLLKRALSLVVAQSSPAGSCCLPTTDPPTAAGPAWTVAGAWSAHRCWRHLDRRQVASRNRMPGRARGQWLAFRDSDDELHPSHLSTRRRAIETQPWFDLWLSPMRVVGSPLVPCMVDQGLMIHLDRCVGVGMLLIRREAMLAIGGFPDVRHAEESALLQRLVFSGISSARLGAHLHLPPQPCQLADPGSRAATDRSRRSRGGAR